MKTAVNHIMPKTTKSPEEIIHLFNTKGKKTVGGCKMLDREVVKEFIEEKLKKAEFDILSLSRKNSLL